MSDNLLKQSALLLQRLILGPIRTNFILWNFQDFLQRIGAAGLTGAIRTMNPERTVCGTAEHFLCIGQQFNKSFMRIGLFPRNTGIDCRLIDTREIRFVDVKVFAVFFAGHIKAPPQTASVHLRKSYHAEKSSADHWCR